MFPFWIPDLSQYLSHSNFSANSHTTDASSRVALLNLSTPFKGVSSQIEPCPINLSTYNSSARTARKHLSSALLLLQAWLLKRFYSNGRCLLRYYPATARGIFPCLVIVAYHRLFHINIYQTTRRNIPEDQCYFQIFLRTNELLISAIVWVK
jgi:hypothetical protein